MNLILLFPSDFLPETQRVRITDRRLKHVRDILKSQVDDHLIVGLAAEAYSSSLRGTGPMWELSGLLGRGKVVKLDSRALEMDVSLDSPPPPKLPIVLCLALMRPIVLKRVLQTAAALGVQEIHLFHSRRVEKSFWQSTALKEEEVRSDLVQGLEQARDTVLPKVVCHRRFKPFVEDVLPALLAADPPRGERQQAGSVRIGVVADPSGERKSGLDISPEAGGSASWVLLLGPEGGFIPYEIDKFREAGCQVVTLGERILRVETAVVSLVSRFSVGC